MSENLSPTAERRAPRVVVIGLASCFGCQINITNIERHLMDVLGQIDLGYWQLTSSVPMPDEFDVAVIEGAVTTEEAAETVRRARERAGSVIAIGSCAVTGGIPGMASDDLAGHVEAVYGDAAPDACGDLVAPRPVSDVIDVDFEVRCCPIDPMEFVRVLDAALYGQPAAGHLGSVRRVLPQREGVLLQAGRHVPGARDALWLRGEVPGAGPSLQRLRGALSRFQRGGGPLRRGKARP